MNRFWRSAAFQKFLLVAISFFLTLSIIELPALFNIFDYQGLEFSGVWGGLRFIRVPDKELTHLEPPHAHHIGSSRGGDFETLYQVPAADQSLYQWDLKYDRNGFRNDTDLDHADIAVIGDSMVEGMTVSTASLITSVLARAEGRSVANLGQYGFGPPEELIVLKRYGLGLKPSVVVWLFTETNDLTDTIGYRAIAAHPPNFWNFFLQRSFSRVVYRSFKRIGAPPKPSGISRSGTYTAPNGEAKHVYFSVDAHPLTADESSALDETKTILETANRLSAAQGAHMLVGFIPDKFRVLRDFCQYPKESSCPEWKLSDLPARMRDVVSSLPNDVGYVDLTPDFVAAAKQGTLPFYTDDVHLSPEGQQIAGRAIDAWLKPHMAAWASEK